MSFAFDDITLVFEGTHNVHPRIRSRGKMPVSGGSKITIEMSGRAVSGSGESAPTGINMVTVNGYTFQLFDDCRQLWLSSTQGGPALRLDDFSRTLTIWIAEDGTHRLSAATDNDHTK